MQINLIADSSVSSAPAGFTAAVEAAAQVYESAFSGDYTVNIRYGWGTYNNQINASLTGATISLGGVVDDNYETYATVKNWLSNDATLSDQQAAIASLPSDYTTLPNQADDFFVSTAEEKALGVYAGTGAAIDGAIGFGTESYNWEGLALCEIGHALGWMTDYYTSVPSILDLFRFSGPGQRQWTGGQPAYFSLNDGANDLGNFATSFDYTLFTGLTNDPFCAPVGPYTLNLTSLDKEVLNVIGFGGKPPSGPQLVITEAYALPGSNVEVLEGTIVSTSPQFSLSLVEGSTTLATSSLQTGGHWSIAVPLSAGLHDLSVTPSNSAQTPGAAVPADLSLLGAASDVYSASAATLTTLTPDQIAALVQSGVTELASNDVSFAFNSAQAAEIQATGLSVGAPAGDRVRENLVNGGVLVYFYGASGALSKVVTHNADGTSDRRIVGVSGVVNNVAFSGYDVFVTASGAGVQKLFLNAQGGDVAMLTFATGGYSLYENGDLEVKRTLGSGGYFDVYRYNHPGHVAGLAFDAIDTYYTASGAANVVDYYDGGAYIGQKGVNADGSFKFVSAPQTGQAYTSFANGVNADYSLAGQSFDYANNTGVLDIYDSNLSIRTGNDNLGFYGPASAEDDFAFTFLTTETVNFAAGANDERLKPLPGFDALTVNGFGGDDIIDLTGCFSSYSAAMAGMTSSGGNVVFTNSASQTVTLDGVDPSTLTAARLGFA